MRSSRTGSASDGHLAALDGLRGLAILLVLAEHLIRLHPVSELERVVAAGAGAGWIGVDLFFALSGFLITGILLDAKGGERYFRNFYLRRALRIFPLYYASLVLIFDVVPHLGLLPAGESAAMVRQQAWFWSYLSNVMTALWGWEGAPRLGFHFWSLAVEEQFYLVWPLLVWLLPRHRVRAAAAGAILGSLAIRLALLAAGAAGVVSYVLAPTHLDPLAAGAWLAATAREPGGLGSLARWVRPLLAVSAAGIGAIILATHDKVADSLAMQSVGYPLLAVGCAAAVAAALLVPPDSRGGRLWRSAPLGLLGRRSYAVYVLHPLLLLLVVSRGYDVPWFAVRLGSQLMGQACFAVLMVLLSLGVATVTWHAWEQPFLRLKARFPMAPPPAGGSLLEPVSPPLLRTEPR